jgi:predicted nucleic acid-binding protein
MAQELPQVASRALVLDANIVLRAVLGVRVRSLIERYIDRVVLLTPASCVAEVKKYLPELCRKRSWEVEPSTELLQSLLETIQVVDRGASANQGRGRRSARGDGFDSV